MFIKNGKVSKVAVGVAICIVSIAFFLYTEEVFAQEDSGYPVNYSQNADQGAAIVGVLAAVTAYSIEQGYSVKPFIQIGKTVANSDHTIAQAGAVIGGKWEYYIGVLGEGDTKNGAQDTSYYGGVSRLVGSSLCIFYGCLKSRIGVAYIPNARLIGESNYCFGFQYDARVLVLDAGHCSSGGIWEENAGLDAVSLRMYF